MTLWSVGHSTHSLERFLDLLRRHSISQLADIRTVPKSRRHPHFGTGQLSTSLPAAGIDYRHLPGLGGFRKPLPDSPNAGWQNISFRGYADYTQTESFDSAFAELCAWSEVRPTAMMCSEALWWRCHRRLVADRLVTSGWEVQHIGPDGRLSAHELTEFAVEREGGLIYPAAQLDIF